jgi:prepilin-type N-terminal cleavage/methylation domain-containing protein
VPTKAHVIPNSSRLSSGRRPRLLRRRVRVSAWTRYSSHPGHLTWGSPVGGAPVAAWRDRHPGSEDRGFALIEVMIAIALLLVVLVPSTQLIETTVQQSINTRDRVTALEMAEQGLEQISNDGITTLEGVLNTNFPVNSITIAGVAYTVTGYLTWLGVGNNPDLCTAGSPPQVMGATATVTWGRNNKLAESTVIDPPYGLAVFYLATGLTQGETNITTLTATTAQTIAAGATLTIGADTAYSQTVTVSAADNGTTTIDVTNSSGHPVTALYNFPANTTPVALPGEGYLAVQVNGGSGGPPADVGDVAVTVTPVSPAGPAQTFYPDNTGCVYEQELPGTYDISVGTGNVSPPPEPFVDLDQDLTPVSNIQPTNTTYAYVVTANTPTSPTFRYDEADLTTFQPAGTLQVATGTPVSVDNTQAHWETVIPAGSSATTAYLYPFSTTQPYGDIWYGDCFGEQPLNENTLQAIEGGTSVVSLGGLDDLALEFTKAGSPYSNLTASATMVNDDPTCSNNDTLGLAAPTAGISQTGVVVDQVSAPGCTLSGSTATCPAGEILASDDGKQVWAGSPGLPSNAYVYNANPLASTFTLSTSPVTSVPLTSTTTSFNFVLIGETYNVTATDSAGGGQATVNNLMVNPNGVVKWGVIPPGTFYQYPLTGTALTIAVP